jgi:signal transduction histidine kinase
MDIKKLTIGTLLGIGIAGIVGLMVVTTVYLNFLFNSTQDIIENSTSRIFDVLTIQRDTSELFSTLEDAEVIETQKKLEAAKQVYQQMYERAETTIQRGRQEKIFIESEVEKAEKILKDVSDLASKIFDMRETMINKRLEIDDDSSSNDYYQNLAKQNYEYNKARFIGYEMSGLVHGVIMRSDGEFRGAMELVQRSQYITWVVVGISLLLAIILGSFIIRFAKKAYDLKNEFIYTISHDLRNPVAAIIGYLELIETDKNMGKKDMQESLQAIGISAQRLRNQINNMLEVGRTESGFVKMNLEPVQVAVVIKESVLRARALAEVEGKKIVYEKAASNDIYVSADKSKLSDVLDNLISNALKYNREKGSVIITTNDLGQTFNISVADTGFGIAKDQQDKLFKKYSRLQAKSEKGVSGTGLGLYTAKLSMEKMNGTISFTSKVNEGTTFTVSLKKVSKPKAE